MQRPPTPTPRHRIDDSPHCRQRLRPDIRRFFSDEELATHREVTDIPEFLSCGAETMPYYKRPEGERSTLHFGQLKLLVAELKFLLRYTTRGVSYRIVYAGAAPGHHIPYLAGLFPESRFYLYDPVTFCPRLRDATPPNVTLFHHTYFTTSIADEYSRSGSDDLILISDIRTGREEDYVETDMEMQELWTRRMRPLLSMLKFRLPWQAGRTPYLSGEIMLPAYAPTTSTEMRLVCTRKDVVGSPRVYDNRWYEEACMFHNTVGRVRTYQHDVECRGLDGCHDCTMLVLAATEYYVFHGIEPSKEVLATFIETAIRSFEMGRTLETEYYTSTTRRR